MKHSLTDNYLQIINTLSVTAITKTLHENLKTVWRQAARAFFREVAAAIAIDTGMSRASLLPLAAKVQYATELQRYLTRGNTAKKGWTDIDGVYHPDGFRSKTQGVRESESKLGSTQRIEFGTPLAPTMLFEFEIAIYQWAKWENEANWNALGKGVEAFQATFNYEFNKRVRVSDIIKYLETGRTTDRSQ